MRPVVLINHLVEPPHQITGITRYTFGLLEALIRRGDTQIVLATTWPQRELPESIANGCAAVETLPFVQSTPLNILRQSRQLRRLVEYYKVDVVYAMNPLCPPVRGVPSIITVHDLYLEIAPHQYKRRYRVWWRIFFSRGVRRSTGVAFVSANTASDAIRNHSTLSTKAYIVNGAGVLPKSDTASRAFPIGAPYVLLLGNLAPNKNIGFAVDALRLLANQGTPVRAIHVGRDSGGMLAELLSENEQSLMASLGSVDDGTLDCVLRHATALLQPSRYEGFGLPIIEAQERGIPVIATDIAVFHEVAGEGAIFVGLDDVPGLARAVHAVATEPELRNDLSAKALANSARFTWDNSASQAVAMILAICPSNPS